jgi:hypothetical protein
MTTAKQPATALSMGAHAGGFATAELHHCGGDTTPPRHSLSRSFTVNRQQIFRGLIVQAMLASASFLLAASWREVMEPSAATRQRQGSVAADLLNFRDGPE